MAPNLVLLWSFSAPSTSSTAKETLHQRFSRSEELWYTSSWLPIVMSATSASEVLRFPKLKPMKSRTKPTIIFNSEKMHCVYLDNSISKSGCRIMKMTWTTTLVSMPRLRMLPTKMEIEVEIIDLKSLTAIIQTFSETGLLTAIHLYRGWTCPGLIQTTSGGRWWHRPRNMKLIVQVRKVRLLIMSQGIDKATNKRARHLRMNQKKVNSHPILAQAPMTMKRRKSLKRRARRTLSLKAIAKLNLNQTNVHHLRKIAVKLKPLLLW